MDHSQMDHSQMDHSTNTNPCTDKLTDIEYLEHMIPHHQVAVDISYMLQKQTKDPVMQDILRKLIWLQEYEIKLMETMLKKIPLNMSSSQRKMKLVSGRLSDSNWVSTAPRGVGSFISNDFSPNQFYYMVTQAIN